MFKSGLLPYTGWSIKTKGAADGEVASTRKWKRKGKDRTEQAMLVSDHTGSLCM